MKSILASVFFGLFSITTLSQNPNISWANHYSDGTVRIHATVVDDNNNVYSTGRCAGTISFGGQSFTSPGSSIDFFVTKTDANGNLVWAQIYGGNSIDIAHGISLRNNELFITGSFSETVDFDYSASTSTHTSLGASDVFILKLDTAGNYLWSKALSGPSYNSGKAITHDPSGNVYVTGYYQGVIDLDPSAQTDSYNYEGVFDAFLVKLSNSGSYLWGFGIGGIYNDEGTTLVYDETNDHIIVGGRYGAPFDYDPSASTEMSSHIDDFDGFYASYNSNGTYNWGQSIRGLGKDEVEQLVIHNQKLMGIGSFNDSLNYFSNSPKSLVSNGGTDVVWFSANLSDGSIDDIHHLGGNDDDRGLAITLDHYNNLYLGGIFEDDIYLDKDSISGFYSATDTNDVFIASYNANNNYRYGYAFTGGGVDFISSLTTHNTPNRVWASLEYKSDIDLSAIAGGISYTATHDYNSTLIEIEQCPTSVTNISVDQCTPYTTPSGDVISTSGIYYDTLMNQFGCDSTFVMDLTVSNSDLSVTITDSSLISNATSGATFQWLDCDQNYSTVAGATHQELVTSNSNSYAVEVDFNGCIDTSECFSINDLAIHEARDVSELDFHVFPNPSTGLFRVIFPQKNKPYVLKIFTTQGKEVFTTTVKGDVSVDKNLPKGIYIVQLSAEGASVTKKLIIH